MRESHTCMSHMYAWATCMHESHVCMSHTFAHQSGIFSRQDRDSMLTQMYNKTTVLLACVTLACVTGVQSCDWCNCVTHAYMWLTRLYMQDANLIDHVECCLSTKKLSFWCLFVDTFLFTSAKVSWCCFLGHPSGPCPVFLFLSQLWRLQTVLLVKWSVPWSINLKSALSTTWLTNASNLLRSQNQSVGGNGPHMLLSSSVLSHKPTNRLE